EGPSAGSGAAEALAVVMPNTLPCGKLLNGKLSRGQLVADSRTPSVSRSRSRSWWGWGATDQALPDAECVALGSLVPGAAQTPLPVTDISALTLPKVRIEPPAALAPLMSAAPQDRASHTYGKAYRDVIRALDGDLAAAPDQVARPRTEQDVI